MTTTNNKNNHSNSNSPYSYESHTYFPELESGTSILFS
uniref:Uncharacterized protein n=1 Tax=Rhizophora mucronata TaxID=61149 RepID=A0A2P2J1L0_RHIMU